jgi:hypothetical protein
MARFGLQALFVAGLQITAQRQAASMPERLRHANSFNTACAGNDATAIATLTGSRAVIACASVSR